MKKIDAAVIIPSSAELETTFQQGLSNLVNRMEEAKSLSTNSTIVDVSWMVCIGINGQSTIEDFQRVQFFINNFAKNNREVNFFCHYFPTQKGVRGKERAMNLLSKLAVENQRTSNLFLFGTDVKVYREPNSLQLLLERVLEKAIQGDPRNFTGGNILPYKLEDYKKYLEYRKLEPITEEEEFYYEFFEIEKKPEILAVLPKNHFRGGLFASKSPISIPEDVYDDWSITRIEKAKHGPNSIDIVQSAIGRVIPRISILDFFGVRWLRSFPHEEYLKKHYPHWETKEPSKEKVDKYLKIKEISLDLYNLLQAKDLLSNYARIFYDKFIVGSENPDLFFDQIANELRFFKKFTVLNKGNFLEATKIDIETAVKMLLLYHKNELLEVLRDHSKISYGNRNEKVRGMIPLDDKDFLKYK